MFLNHIQFQLTLGILSILLILGIRLRVLHLKKEEPWN